MGYEARVLVIGPDSFGSQVSAALPHCERIATNNPLAGLWQLGHQPCQAVLLALSTGRHALRAVRSMRRLTPQTPIVVVCAPSKEPDARRALAEGASDYVLEPFTAEDLARASGISPAQTPRPAGVAEAPARTENVQLAQVLQSLAEGPQATLYRLATMVRAAYESTFVTIELEKLSVSAGAPGPALIREPILRGHAPVGMLSLGRPSGTAYAAGAVSRLADYARLIEAVMTLTSDRARWQELAWTDDLSRLRNRRYFEHRCDELLPLATRQRAQLTLLLCDIDDFKHYNDRFGHDTGDALIRELAILLRRCSRESDIVARYGGDEFAVIFWDAGRPRVPGSHHPTDFVALAERYRQAIGAHTFQCLGQTAPGPVTISGGLASFPWDGRTCAELVRAADEALLAAKRAGKNRILLAGGNLSAGS